MCVNGLKVARVYGWYQYLPRLGEGQHTIVVALQRNDHSPDPGFGFGVPAEVDVHEVDTQVDHKSRARRQIPPGELRPHLG